MTLQNQAASTSKTVYLIEDSLEMRVSIEKMLTFLGYFVVPFSNGSDFLAAQIHAVPAVLVMDMRMPDLTGVEIQTELLNRGRNLPIIFISGESTVAQSVLAMKQGAIEFLLKPFERDVFMTAIERGLEINARNMRALIQQRALDQGLKALSPRERETFELLAKGYSNAELMDALSISLPTAKQYKSEVMRKLNLRSIAQLISLKSKGE